MAITPNTKSDQVSESAERRAATQAYDFDEPFAEQRQDQMELAAFGDTAQRTFYGDPPQTTAGQGVDSMAVPEVLQAVSLIIPAVQAAREAPSTQDNTFSSALAKADLDDGYEAVGVAKVLTKVEPEMDKTALPAAVLLSDAAATGSGDIAAPPSPSVGYNVIEGSALRDVLNGSSGDDFIYGYGNEDRIFGKGGSDFLFGGSGGDDLFGGNGMDFLYGGSGGDMLDGGKGPDYLYGEGGGDTLIGRGGENTLYGGGGSDLMYSHGGDDAFDGGNGGDTVTYQFAEQGVTAWLWLAGTQDTGDGLDSFVDVENLTGSDYDDWLAGDAENNWLEGGDGEDTIDGGFGDDYLGGGNGYDTLSGGPGNDIYDGGAGGDTASFTGAASGIVVDLLHVGPQNTGEGIDSFFDIEHIHGSSLGDLIRGDGNDNSLRGYGGGDWIWGEGGNDDIRAGDGNDVIAGGAGNDWIYGGDGADAIFAGSFFGDGGHDTIWDFEDGIDKVFVGTGFGISDFSDITIDSSGDYGFAVANFANGDTIQFYGRYTDTIGEDDFVFY